MSTTSEMRKLIQLVESVTIKRETKKDGEVKRVVAYLTDYDSGKYTRLGRNLLAIQKKSDEIKQLQEAVKEDTKVLIAGLFSAEDCAYTRVVETLNFVFQLSKDPKAADTVKYKEVLTQLRDHLTPALIKVLDGLILTHTTHGAPKSPSISAVDKNPPKSPPEPNYNIDLDESESGDEFDSLNSKIQNWARAYDQQLNKLKRMV